MTRVADAPTIRALGVPQLDRLLAPLPERSTLLFLADPGLEAEPFLYQAANASLREGRDVVYAVLNRSPDALLRSMEDYGFSPQAGPGRLLVLDAYSALMGAGSGSAYSVAKPNDPEDFARVLDKAATEHSGALLLVDPLSTLIDNSTPEAFTGAADRILAAMRRFAGSAAVFHRWPYPPHVLEAVARFDATVALRAVEDRVTLSQYFRVEHVAWKPDVDAKPRVYKSVKPGGILVYIPKIVVTGPFNAGKSAFVHAVSDAAVSADHMGTTVALDHGRATMEGLTADVFGTPGQARFDPILKVVAGQAVGTILVVDSTKPDSLPRAREMLDLTWRHGLPAIVAANKQDKEDALPPAEVERLLRPPPNVRVVGCVASDRDSARRVLKLLVDQILEGRVSA